MAQSSGPIAVGTVAERQFSDVIWRNRFGDEPGVLGDMNGSSYALTLPAGSDVASVGSTTQASLATVAGFSHSIPAAAPETITIPPAVGSARNDIISLRYDPAYTGAPGPVRLFRIAGAGTALPTYDASPPGIEDLPLWSVTRSPGQSLSLAIVKRMFPRIALSLEVGINSPLPLSSPLGTIARQGTSTFRRALDASSNPVWLSVSAEYKAGETTIVTNATGGVQVTHDLGRVPTAVMITPVRDSAAGFTATAYAKTATTFNVRFYNNDATYNNASITFGWMVL